MTLKSAVAVWAATPGAAEQPPQPRWYTPARLLAFFCTITMVTWMDLGIFASNWVTGEDDAGQPQGVKGEFGLSGFELGLLPALYAVGLCIFSFVFSELALTYNSFRLIGAGILAWSVGAAMTGAATSYAMLIVARIIVGAGRESMPCWWHTQTSAGPSTCFMGSHTHHTCTCDLLHAPYTLRPVCARKGSHLVVAAHIWWHALYVGTTQANQRTWSAQHDCTPRPLSPTRPPCHHRHALPTHSPARPSAHPSTTTTTCHPLSASPPAHPPTDATMSVAGEAPLLTLTFTFVDEVAPLARKSLWFGVLGTFPSLGIALGYVLAEVGRGVD